MFAASPQLKEDNIQNKDSTVLAGRMNVQQLLRVSSVVLALPTTLAITRAQGISSALLLARV